MGSELMWLVWLTKKRRLCIGIVPSYAGLVMKRLYCVSSSGLE